MPWEKSFDEEEAIEKAMQIFWEKGYEPASMADLIEGTGINRGSLYNAFGGKEQLFIKSLLKYDQANRREILAQLEALDDPKEAFRRMFDGLVKEATSDTSKKGCFMINTALNLAAHPKEIQKIVTKGLGETEAFFRRGIEVAQARREMSTSQDPAALAKTLMGFVVAIRVLARGVYKERDLRCIANQVQRLVA